MILVELIKAKEKSVMTKRELILYAIKTYIFFTVVFYLMYLFIGLLAKQSNSVLVDDKPFFIVIGIMALFAYITPGITLYVRWKRWHSYFPKTLYLNPKTRAKKMPEHYDDSMDVIAYLLAADELHENKLSHLSEDDKEYLMYLLDSYYGKKWLDNISAPYTVDSN